VGREEEVARTPAIGTAKFWKEFEGTPQLVGQHTFPIRRALSVDDRLEFPILEKIVNVPVKPLCILEVAI
jgi:hypothetical protein